MSIKECIDMINGRIEKTPSLSMRAWDERDGALEDLYTTLSFLFKEDFDFQSCVRQSENVRQGCASKTFTGSGPCNPNPQDLTLRVYLEAGKYIVSITLFDKMIFCIKSQNKEFNSFIDPEVLDVPSSFVQMSYFVSSFFKERVIFAMDRINSVTKRHNEDVSRFLIKP